MSGDGTPATTGNNSQVSLGTLGLLGGGGVNRVSISLSAEGQVIMAELHTCFHVGGMKQQPANTSY